jgi:hypothetical protein
MIMFIVLLAFEELHRMRKMIIVSIHCCFFIEPNLTLVARNIGVRIA